VEVTTTLRERPVRGSVRVYVAGVLAPPAFVKMALVAARSTHTEVLRLIARWRARLITSLVRQ
jgi:hypothetical protein